MRRAAVPLLAAVLVACVLGVELLAGGGRYTPLRPADPCTLRTTGPTPTTLEPLAAQIVLFGLDRAACHLWISRERLVLRIASSRGAVGARVPDALKAGLHEAIKRLARSGLLLRTSQLLPQALDQADVPGFARTIIEAIPGTIVDRVLPLEPLLNQTVDDLNVARLLRQLHDPQKLDGALRSAILHAVLQRIIDRLAP